MTTEQRFTREFFKKEIAEGSLFLLEKYLTQLPIDWIDCIAFISTQGLKEIANEYLITMDDDQTKKFIDLIEKRDVKLFVISNDKKIIWNLLITKHKNHKTGDFERLFIGGENLRKFCDKKNIFYKSKKVENGEILSGTTMMYEKHPGQDCRICD